MLQFIQHGFNNIVFKINYI